MDEDITRRLEEAIGEFRRGAEYQYLEGQRIARRTAQIVRWSFAGMVLLGIGLATLIFVLTQNMIEMTRYMEGMHGHTGEMNAAFSSVEKDMTAMQADMGAITPEMQKISSSMITIQEDVTLIPTSLDLMNQRVNGLRQSVVSMDERMQVLNGQMNGINDSVYRITRDTGEMSRPMRMFPWP